MTTFLGSIGLDSQNHVLQSPIQRGQDRAQRGNSLTHALQRFDAIAAPCVESVAQPGQLIEANARFEQAAHKAQPLQRPLVIKPPTVLQATHRMHLPAQHIIAQDMDADTGRTSKP